MTFLELLGAQETFEEMISLIKEYEGDIFEGSLHQPECIVHIFGGLDYSDAIILANAMKQRFGDIILCCEASVAMEEPITLLDELDDFGMEWMIVDDEERETIVQAFIDCGFKRAHECGSALLRRMFCSQEGYESLADTVFMYDFDAMKANREWLYPELMEEIHKPWRIQRWIDRNPDKMIEEYLQL